MPTSHPADPLISVVIVNYKVPQLLRQALRSLCDADLFDRTEVIVVDNASGDDSRGAVIAEFPFVRWIGLKSNIGFGKACNVGASQARGDYLLLQNPDTLVRTNTLAACAEFMEQHPRAGLMGPKIINPDGTLQASCRRSFPTPAVAFYHFSGLARVFPNSRRFGRYNLTYLDPNKTAQVDAVSGSFMFMRRSLFTEIGGFDERFFMYGEDLDLCWCVCEKGMEVWYHPATQIVHFKGQSTAKRSLRSRAAFWEAMVLFSRKHRRTHKSFFPSWIVLIGIILVAGVNIGASLFRSLTACFIDLLIINATTLIGISVRFALSARQNPYLYGGLLSLILMHVLLSVIFLSSFWYRGVYSQGRYSVKNAFVGGMAASAIFMACVYFISTMAFSRIAFAFTSIAVTFLLVLWREALPRALHRIQRLIYSTGTVIVLGNGPVAAQLIRNLEEDRSARIAGVIWPEGENPPGEFEGYPVLGAMAETRAILARGPVDALMIATTVPWYSFIIEALSALRIHNLSIKWVPPEIASRHEKELPQVIPLQDFSV